jgi:hypothetical protein
MIVAALALTVALIGATIAGADAAKKPLSKAKVAKIAKKNANAVVSEREAALNVNSAKTADTAASAARADSAATAITADSAKTADAAASVNGVSLSEIDYEGASGSGRAVVFEGSGMRLQAECEAGIEVGVRATSLRDDATIVYSLIDTDFDADSPITSDVENRGFDTNESVRMDDDASDSGLITFEYHAPDGSTVTGDIGIDEVQADGQPAVCDVRGHVFAS